MKINISTKNIGQTFEKHTGLLLVLIVVVVLALEFFVIKRSVNMVLSVKGQVPNVSTRIVRVNMAQYAEIEKQLEDNSNFTASGTPLTNPFGNPPEPGN